MRCDCCGVPSESYHLEHHEPEDTVLCCSCFDVWYKYGDVNPTKCKHGE